MADSTPYVLTAGGIVAVSKLMSDGSVDIPAIAATGFSAIALAGLDATIPGAGKGVALLGLVVVFLTHIPTIATHLPKGKSN